MKKEQGALIISIIFNIFVTIIKIGTGLVFNFTTLIADGIYTLSDLVTDFLAIIGSFVGHKRANKKHPFGYGRFLYIMQIFMGILILVAGAFTIYIGIVSDFQKVNLSILFLILIVILLKGLSSNYLMQVGKNISSVMLINSAKESFIDVLSSIMVGLVAITSQFFPMIDLIGSIIIGVLIISEALKIITNNVILLIGEDDNNKEIKQKLKNIINKFKKIEYSDSFLIKNGYYYQATLEIAVNEDIKVKELLSLERKIRKKIKENKDLHIRYIDFDVIKD